MCHYNYDSMVIIVSPPHYHHHVAIRGDAILEVEAKNISLIVELC